MKKSRLQILALLSAAALIMAGCSGGSTSDGGSGGGSGGSGAKIETTTEAAGTGADAAAADKDKDKEKGDDSEKAGESAEDKADKEAKDDKADKEDKTGENAEAPDDGAEEDSKTADNGADADTEAEEAGAGMGNAVSGAANAGEGKPARPARPGKTGTNDGKDSAQAAADEKVRLLKVSVDQKHVYDYLEVEEISAEISCDGSYSTLVLDRKDTETYPELAKAISEFNTQKEEIFAEVYGDVVSESSIGIEAQRENSGIKEWEDVSWLQFYTHSTLQVSRADSRVVSVVSQNESYMGGPHGYYEYRPTNFDTQTGKEIGVDDIFKDRRTLDQAIRTKLYDHYNKEELSFLDDYLDSVGSGQGWQSEGFNFSVLNEGVMFYFNPYDIAPYASGSQAIYFSYKDDSAVFSPKAAKYMETPDSFMEPLLMDVEYQTDVDGNGESDTVKFVTNYEYNQEYDYSWETFSTEINYATTNLSDIDGYTLTPYLVKNGKNKVFWLFTMSDNDYEICYTYEMRKNHPFLLDFENLGINYDYNYSENFSENIYGPTNNPANILLDSRMNALGTFTGTRRYRVGANGTPEPTENYYEINTDFEMTVTAPFSGKKIDESGKSSGNFSVKPGDKFRVVRTDNRSWIEAKVNGKNLVRFDYDNSFYPNTLDGKDESTLFDFLPYAG